MTGAGETDPSLHFRGTGLGRAAGTSARNGVPADRERFVRMGAAAAKTRELFYLMYGGRRTADGQTERKVRTINSDARQVRTVASRSDEVAVRRFSDDNKPFTFRYERKMSIGDTYARDR